MKRIEEELRLIRQQMEEEFLLHSERISAQKQSIARVERALKTVHDSIGQLRHEFEQFAHTSQSHQETWFTERQRNLRVLDVIQTSLLTGSLETESRLERVEQRLSRLEDQQSGAA